MLADPSVPPLQLLSQSQSFGTHHPFRHTPMSWFSLGGGGGVVLPYAPGKVTGDYRVLFWPDACSCTTLAVADRREGLADIRNNQNRTVGIHGERTPDVARIYEPCRLEWLVVPGIRRRTRGKMEAWIARVCQPFNLRTS